MGSVPNFQPSEDQNTGEKSTVYILLGIVSLLWMI